MNQCCRMMEHALEEPLFPITYDLELSEYQLKLAHDDTTGTALLKYCPFCGFKLPRSGRFDLTVEDKIPD
jgi:Domain of unknown function (DUF6980)